MKTTLSITILLIFSFSFIGFSQDGSPDYSFGNNGIVETDIDGEWDFAWDIAQQNDGKLLVAGEGGYQSNGYAILTRYLLDGSLDSSFGINGIVMKSYNVGSKFSFIKFHEPSMIVAGIRYGGNMGGYRMSRFFENGDIDGSFGVNGDLFLTPNDESVKGLQFLENGTFITIGETTNSPSEIIIRRYLVNGELDTSFGVNGAITTMVGNEDNFSIKFEITDNGNFVVLIKTYINGIQQYFLLKYLPNGVLDTSFGNNGIADIPGDEISCNFKIASNGKIVVRCINYDSKYFLRLLSSGNLDTTFGNNGSFTYTFPFNLFIVQENQRIVLYGNGQDPFEGGGFLEMIRYYVSGFTDSSFNHTNNYSELNNSKAIIQSDGKIVVVGSSMWYNGAVDFVIQRFNNNPLGVTENDLSTLSIYPNPSNGIFKIKHDFITSEKRYQITDITGKLIQKGKLSGDQTTLDLSAMRIGVYFFNAYGSTLKLVKN